MKFFQIAAYSAAAVLGTGISVWLGSEPRPTHANILRAPLAIPVAHPVQIPEDTPPAPHSSAGLISFSVAGDNTHYLKGKTTKAYGYFYAELKAGKYQADPGKKRTPLNLSLVIDRSGSMEGDKLAYVKKAAAFVVDNLGEDDLLSIVIYDSQVKVLVPTGKMTNKASAKNLIAAIESGSSTNLSGGMIEGFKQVKSQFKSGYMNRVLLLTDGLANEGIVDPARLQSLVQIRNKSESISISTFGVGADFNEDLLQNLSEFGSGNYYFIGSPDKIPEIFQKEMKGLLSVVAQNVTLQIQLPSFVQLDKVYGFPYEINNGQIQVGFKDLFSEETKAVLIRYNIPFNCSEDIQVTAKVNYDDVSQESVPNIQKSLGWKSEPTAALQMLENGLNKNVVQQITLFESNEKLEEAMKAVDKGEYQKARGLVNENKIYLKEKMRYLPASSELIKQDSINMHYEKSIQNAESMNAYDMKMMQKSSKMMNYEVKKKK